VQVEVRTAETEGVHLAVQLLEQLLRPCRVPIRAKTFDNDGLAEDLGLETVIT